MSSRSRLERAVIRRLAELASTETIDARQRLWVEMRYRRIAEIDAQRCRATARYAAHRDERLGRRGPLARIAQVVVALIVVALALNSATATPGTAALAATLALSPASGTVGSSVSVSGSGFGVDKLQLLWDGSTTGMPTVQANGTGTFHTSFSVPLMASSGGHTVSAASMDTSSKTLGVTIASTPFSVVSASVVVSTTAPSPSPAPTASPTPTPAPTASPTPAPTASPAPTPAPTSSTTGVMVLAPKAPSAYALPAGAVQVSTSSQLITALAATTPQDIVLANGIYDNTAPFYNANGHRLYAASLGGAVLRAGLTLGGNWGQGNGLVRGVSFDVSDPTKTLANSVIHIWGPGGVGSQVLDVTIAGHSAIASGIEALPLDRIVIQRVVVRNVTDYGVLVLGGTTLSTPTMLEDANVAGVMRAVPGSSNGTAEACLWLANTVTVRRALVRSCGIAGLWTGNTNSGSLLEHLDIDGTPVGVYMEHYTTGTTVQYLNVGTSVSTGVNCEWADPLTGGKPACVSNVVQYGTIASSKVGVFLDEGTTGVTLRGLTFRNQWWAAIGDYKGVNNTYYNNDYSGIDAGAVPISYAHVPQ